MPELPEVETIKLGLEKHLVGRQIDAIVINQPKIFIGNTNNAVGAIVKDVRRFGKGLVIDFDNGYSMAVHVKMTGQLVVKRVSGVSSVSGVLGAFPKHTHVVFTLSYSSSDPELAEGKSRSNSSRQARTIKDKDYLYYNDVRRFGWIKVLRTEDVPDLPFFKSLGLEPLRDLTLDKFKVILKRNKTPIKSLLMNQQKIAGIGNIYACDALYFAKIHPTRSSSSLRDEEAALLFSAIEEILRKSISVGGASANNYVNALGERGTYQDHFLVYKKEGEPCVNCDNLILRVKTGGRSTYFCEVCQK